MVKVQQVLAIIGTLTLGVILGYGVKGVSGSDMLGQLVSLVFGGLAGYQIYVDFFKKD